MIAPCNRESSTDRRTIHPYTIIMLFSSATAKMLSRVVRPATTTSSNKMRSVAGSRFMSSTTFDLTGAFKVWRRRRLLVGLFRNRIENRNAHTLLPFTYYFSTLLLDALVGLGSFRIHRM
jgi:hypothetical protein